MNYLGDVALGVTFDTKFTTVTTTGAPTVLAGTPAISAYVDNDVTQLTAGITLSVDFDGVVGLNNIRVVATSGNGYAAGSNYQLVITTGTVGGTSVVGYVVAEFSIEARSALRPTTAARTLDVSAGGEAGVDWANVGSPTTAVNLSATNIDVDQVVASVSGAVGSVTGAVGSVTGAVGSVGSGGITAASFAAGAIDAAAIAANAIGASELAADAVTEIQTAILSDATPFAGANIGTILSDTNDLQTRVPAALTAGGNIKADMLALDGSTTAATNLKQAATVIYVGSVTGATSTTTLIDSALTQADTDFWKGRIVIFLTGALKYQATDITGFTPATDTLTFTAVTTAPSGGDTYVVL